MSDRSDLEEARQCLVETLKDEDFQPMFSQRQHMAGPALRGCIERALDALNRIAPPEPQEHNLKLAANEAAIGAKGIDPLGVHAEPPHAFTCPDCGGHMFSTNTSGRMSSEWLVHCHKFGCGFFGEYDKYVKQGT